MDKIKISCICKPAGGVVVKGSMEICKGQNILQSVKEWYGKQITDLAHPVSFEDCFVHVDGAVVSQDASTFIDDVYVNGDSILYIIPRRK